ncbi:polyribonucleotide nucleotidyltransferase [Candidatus Collierbacteria bacterium]|nr:polyribonucleotide nucleotidyltransferase [Candidatus Collierbacteria bacterium]
METKSAVIDLAGKKITLETGLLAPQASGAVTARCGDTLVLATVVSGRAKDGIDFLPLTVEYREKHYAGGIISSSRFVKREGRPSDNETLTSRLIDRSIRPLFPKNLYDEIQVVVSPLSIDGENEPEILSLIATSAAIALSDIPWDGPIGSVRLGQDPKGQLIVNPTTSEKATSTLDLVVSGGVDFINMVEAGANEVSESQVLSALNFGQDQLASLVQAISQFVSDIKKPKKEVAPYQSDPKLQALVKSKLNPEEIVKESVVLGGEGINIDKLVADLLPEGSDEDKLKLAKIIDSTIKDHIRSLILDKNLRPDGRKPEDIRPIDALVGILPRTHGSALFRRGMTHALSVVTLGSPASEQLIDGMKGEETKRYFHHYNMPGYATGEPGRIGAPNRREIGHGALAERALTPVLPSNDEFPYTTRVVSEISSSNGSTSQASVCGSTLALMDAGVPIKKPVAGIAMGLVMDDKKVVTLSDIAGIEDFNGDMDFKVAGTADGITAIQMDVKVKGVNVAILASALEQARSGRLHILKVMLQALDKPRAEVSNFAPKIRSLKIPVEKIGELIGPGGKVIRQIQVDFQIEVNVEDDGVVTVSGIDKDMVDKAFKYVSDLMAEAEVGKVYSGTVARVEPYGAFVQVLPGKDGLVHVSRMSTEYVADASQILKVGDQVEVKVYEIDSQGRINLTMLLNDEQPSKRPERPGDSDRPFRDTGRRPSGSFKRFRDHR